MIENVGSVYCAVSLIEERAEMTRQNVVVADAKSGINVAITMTVSNQSLFTKTREAQGGCITIPAKKVGGGARINTWLDSMRASSPPRVKPAISVPDQSSWMVSTLLPVLVIKINICFTSHLLPCGWI